VVAVCQLLIKTIIIIIIIISIQKKFHRCNDRLPSHYD